MPLLVVSSRSLVKEQTARVLDLFEQSDLAGSSSPRAASVAEGRGYHHFGVYFAWAVVVGRSDQRMRLMSSCEGLGFAPRSDPTQS